MAIGHILYFQRACLRISYFGISDQMPEIQLKGVRVYFILHYRGFIQSIMTEKAWPSKAIKISARKQRRKYLFFIAVSLILFISSSSLIQEMVSPTSRVGLKQPSANPFWKCPHCVPTVLPHPNIPNRKLTPFLVSGTSHFSVRDLRVVPCRWRSLWSTQGLQSSSSLKMESELLVNRVGAGN